MAREKFNTVLCLLFSQATLVAGLSGVTLHRQGQEASPPDQRKQTLGTVLAAAGIVGSGGAAAVLYRQANRKRREQGPK